jgi:hypothetical protein
MKSTANAIRLTYNEQSRPELTLTLSCSKQEAMTDIAELKGTLAKGKELAVEIKQKTSRRSLDSNSYCWILCQKIAEVIRSTKEEVYRKAIREVGQFETLAVQENASEQFIKVWNSRGLGWYAEEMDSKIQGCKKIIAYYGSSCYDVRSMCALINYIVDECKTLGIETLPPEQLAAMNREWGEVKK